MNVLNLHERELPVSAVRAGALIDTLASPTDSLWPRQCWPAMELAGGLRIGAMGGHGPVRYQVEAYCPGSSVTFRFLAPRGFDGYHRFEVEERTANTAILRHTIRMNASGAASLSWPMVFRPLHDALIEDCLANAEAALGLPSRSVPWSRWVKVLRWFLSGGKRRPQTKPAGALAMR